VHISVGDLLREEANSDVSMFAEFINDSIRNSVIMPAELTIQLLRKRINDSWGKGKRIFIVDGFPRSLEQAHAFEEKVYNTDHTHT
jgi:UMP-CMP kinase